MLVSKLLQEAAIVISGLLIADVRWLVVAIVALMILVGLSFYAGYALGQR